MKRTRFRLRARLAGLAALAIALGALTPMITTSGEAEAAQGALIQPVNGTVTGYLNYRCGSGTSSHAGVDIAGNNGQPIIAAAAGRVSVRQVSFASTGYGNMVTLQHDSGYTTLYAHMNAAPAVQQGQYVGQGQVLGYVGSTGNSTGPHLHFEVKRNGTNLSGSLGYSCGEYITRGTPIPYSFPSLGTGIGTDYNSDGRDDFLGVHNDGRLLLYQGNNTGSVSATTQIGSGWSAMTDIVRGDFNADGKADVLSTRNDGSLVFYGGTGTGGFSSKVNVGSGWTSMALLTGGVDFTGDGRADILARRNSTGNLMMYPGNGSGGFQPARTVGPGWGDFRMLAVGEYTGDGKADLLGVDGSNNLRLYVGNGSGAFSSNRIVGPGWGSIKEISGAIDLNNDGKTDLLAKDSSGNLRFYAGNGTGGFAPATTIGSGWQNIRILG